MSLVTKLKQFALYATLPIAMSCGSGSSDTKTELPKRDILEERYEGMCQDFADLCSSSDMERNYKGCRSACFGESISTGEQTHDLINRKCAKIMCYVDINECNKKYIQPSSQIRYRECVGEFGDETFSENITLERTHSAEEVCQQICVKVWDECGGLEELSYHFSDALNCFDDCVGIIHKMEADPFFSTSEYYEPLDCILANSCESLNRNFCDIKDEGIDFFSDF
jgi:hypothetical protein